MVTLVSAKVKTYFSTPNAPTPVYGGEERRAARWMPYIPLSFVRRESQYATKAASLNGFLGCHGVIERLVHGGKHYQAQYGTKSKEEKYAVPVVAVEYHPNG